ncbi:MAG TPA: TraB/GumN family protein [Deltaproteobacteria bacterium]|nr:TraB/GumN family protein [Deltaproteobacteria bacterium]HPP80852.1 TraB/GumN family protein [Deltaproteobacteria bacterium]
MPVETIRLGDREITLVGTAHVSKSSVEEVRETILSVRPDVVAVELCSQRRDVMRNPGLWQETDIFEVIRKKKASFLLANLVLSSFQRRIGKRLGVKPGDEMRAAMEEAEASGIEVALVDRDVRVTLARAWRTLSFLEKVKLLWAALVAVFEADELGEDDIERLKEQDALTVAVDAMAKTVPTVKKVLVDERDAYMAKKIADLEARRVVAVLGAGHLAGVAARLGDTSYDIGPLEEIPEGGFRYWGWVLPAAFVALVLAGFVTGGAASGIRMIAWWAGITMACTALATALTMAHPVTVVVATLVAPLTTLHPALASGWFAGMSEAYFKRPRVVDFERIHEDILTLKGWWQNPITRILLVFFMSNLGSSVGVFIAAPVLARLAVRM